MKAGGKIQDDKTQSELFSLSPKLADSNSDHPFPSVIFPLCSIPYSISRFSFSGKDLSGISIPRADLRHAFMCSTNLTNACLRQVNFVGAQMSDTKLDGADCTDMILGIHPILKGHSREVTSAHFSPDGSQIVSSSDDKTGSAGD